jgi:hypothetical protein
VAHRVFAEMAERRIADVVRQAGGGDDMAELGRLDVAQPVAVGERPTDETSRLWVRRVRT